MEKLPEGYIASNPDPTFYAVDSATLWRRGDFHGANGGNVGIIESGIGWGIILGMVEKPRSLDQFVELNINGDPRLEKLKEYARKLGDKYSHLSSPEYIKNAAEREKKITDLLTPKIYETYGSYSNDTLKNISNVEEKNASGGLTFRRSAQLAKMEHGSFVCRHYAPVMSVLLHEARIPNHLACSCVTVGLEQKNGEYKIVKDNLDYHAYVITQEGNAIVEGTVAGEKDERGTYVTAYKPVINKVTTEDIVFRGHAALTEDGCLYGGHLGDGDGAPEKVRRGQELSLQRYHESLAPAARVSAERLTTQAIGEQLVPASPSASDTQKLVMALEKGISNTLPNNKNIGHGLGVMRPVNTPDKTPERN